MRLFTFSLLVLSIVASMGQGQAPPADAKPETRQQPPRKPGKDRWSIKTASDSEADKVKQRPIKTTVEKLLAQPRPADMPLSESSPKYQAKRAEPVETSVWTAEADVIEYRLMPDGDYRVVIRGASGQTMVLEMPDPDPEFVSPESPFAYAIKAARDQFDSKYKPEREAKTASAHARITGIGFFGRMYGAKKDATGNQIQLHPVLDIVWMDKPSAEFTKQSKIEKPPESPRR